MNLSRQILLVLLALMLAGCSRTPAETAPETTAQTTEATEATEITVPETTAETVLHSGIRQDGSFDEHTLFMGDSLTFSLVEHELRATGMLGDARYAGKCGAHVSIYHDGTRLAPDGRAWCYYSEEFQDMTMPEALRSVSEEILAIYYMFGTNFDREGTSQDYVEVLDDILEACPQATVYLQTVPQGNLAWVAINDRIQEAYEHYAALGEERIQLLDIGGTIGKHVVNDGVHQTPYGRQLWVQAIRDYAEQNNISE